MRLLLIILAFSFSTGIFAVDCGDENKRPCRVFERVPSCNTGLVENFSQGKCLRPATSKPAPQPAQTRAPITAKQRPDTCGHRNQPPCKVWEFVPSCEIHLVEGHGRCITPQEAKSNERPSWCGKENYRACRVDEFIPSCAGSLVEREGMCVDLTSSWPKTCGDYKQRPCTDNEHTSPCRGNLKVKNNMCDDLDYLGWPENCGHKEQRACTVDEFVPSCEGNLVEAHGKCWTSYADAAKEQPQSTPQKSIECGGKGNRPCRINERVPSCDKGLREDFIQDKCL